MIQLELKFSNRENPPYKLEMPYPGQYYMGRGKAEPKVDVSWIGDTLLIRSKNYHPLQVTLDPTYSKSDQLINVVLVANSYMSIATIDSVIMQEYEGEFPEEEEMNTSEFLNKITLE